MTRDAGQAFPVYLTAVAGLLFLALAYFAVGQAAADRNSAQGAADAAALAAATETRTQLGRVLLENINDVESWNDLLKGQMYSTGPSCASASRFAARNSARVKSCSPLGLPRNGYRVEVRLSESVGSTIIPGTESTYASASATAVVDPRCTVSSEEEAETIELNCKGRTITVDPDDPDPLPPLDRMFTVRLVD
ncbi:pilus assembly protein TadG-related protein [Streptomyces alkaliterrae]|uniref:pilus assembly protein TadG-related protein n=1 Tax=Streptomyces alkaliterrae TaxID=2213162 RepID=UPI002B204586|nr:pilus assembly protein TadG-related protein [Streptomyces alkaliterrae]